MVRIGVGEEKVELSRAQLARQLRLLFGDLLRELGVTRRELVELDQVTRASLELIPRARQLSVLGAFARERAGTARVVPGAGLR